MRDWLYSYSCGAGGGARVKYRDAASRWRKRVFRHPWLILALIAGAILVAVLLDVHGRWPLILGVILGAVFAGFFTILESPPAYIENWRVGSEGELRTARALAPLRRQGYVLLHDLPDRLTGAGAQQANIDHVVVCTGGVFLLDSKYLGGEASIVGEVVHVQRRDDDDASYDLPRLARGMRGRAVRLQEDITQHTGVRFIQPVVVFWNPFRAGSVIGENIAFVHGTQLVGWLEEQPARLSQDTVVRVAAEIAAVRPRERRIWFRRPQQLGSPRARGSLVSRGAARES